MKLGVLLFNLGGPENLDDVRPFLYALFSDPEIIRINNDALRRMLAWFLATTRQYKSRNLYRQIGGGSPLRRITEDQARALHSALNARGIDAQLYVGMRCWRPTIEDAVNRILKDQVTHLVLLPLFPQYSVTTTGSCLKYFSALDRKFGLSSKIRIHEIRTWFDDPRYVECMAAMIQEECQKFPDRNSKPVHLLYSAHSIPARYIDDGDPYLDQTTQSVKLINGRLGDRMPYTLAFQSKLGPVQWLGPSTRDVLRDLGRSGNPAVLVVPVSFVSDHIETLQEIDIAYRAVAQESGIRDFRRVPALNLDPRFIEVLANLVVRAID